MIHSLDGFQLTTYHDSMEFFGLIPLPLLVLLIFAFLLTLIILLVFLRTKRQKKEEETSVISDIGEADNKPLNPTGQQSTTPEFLDTSTQMISTKPAKTEDRKFFLWIVVIAVISAVIPLSAFLIVKKQSSQSQQFETKTEVSPGCTAITITDTLNNALNQEQLAKLRPGDEVKIIISGNKAGLEKGRFRVNGSQWQETTIKNGNNFTGNYILPAGVKKFTIEAEVYDKEKGWL